MIRPLPTFRLSQSVSGIEHILLEIEVCSFAIRSLVAHIESKVLQDAALQVTEELGGNVWRIRKICDEIRSENGGMGHRSYGNPFHGR